MKHLILIALLLFGSAGLYAQKQWAKSRPKSQSNDWSSLYNASLAPASVIFSTLDLGIERRMATRTGLLAQGHFGFRKIQLWESLGGKYINYGGRLEYRNYLGKNAALRNGSLQGPYCSAWIQTQRAQVQATLQQKDYTMVKSQSITPGIGVGWKFPLSRKISNVTLDLSIGGGYKFGNVTGRYAEKSRSILFKDRGFVPAFGLRVGYSPNHGGSIRSKKTSPATEIQMAIAYHDRYSRKKRKAIEKALVRNHLDPGKADGKFDARTIQAIRQFQRKSGMVVDGRVGEATMKALNRR